MNLEFIQIARASSSAESVAEVKSAEVGHEKSTGLSIDPWIVGSQVVNVLVLLFILKAILYKPILKLLAEREHHIKKGVEDADNAKILLQESEVSREKMLKEARTQGVNMVEVARKSGEQLRGDIIAKAENDAQQIVTAGKALVDSEKAKVMQDIKIQAVNMVILAAEKILKEKINPSKDSQLVKEALESYSK